ncbi:metallophosphoesterase, partial [Micromonospora sp. WMMD737]|uniref:metallophosphoesterase n=1 Tax=Micromonospora sp. WMMD737 TaxID=3404113 RepID=UPI003B932E60
MTGVISVSNVTYGGEARGAGSPAETKLYSLSHRAKGFMFLLVLGSILVLMHLYVWKRMVRDTTVPGRTRRLLTVGLVALMALLFAALVVPRVFGVADSGWVAWPGYVWFGLLVYLFLVLLVLEAVRLVAWIRRRRALRPAGRSEEPAEPGPGVDRRVFLARTTAVAAGVTAVGLTGFGMANALGRPELLQVPLRLPRLSPAMDGFRIAVVSDIHLGPLLGRAHTERIVSMINAAGPDLVAVVGDLVDGTVDELGAAAEPLRDLVASQGAFFVTGN